MILLVSMKLFKNYDTNCELWEEKHQFEKLSGHPCVVMNYTKVTMKLIEDENIKAVFIGGFGRNWADTPVKTLQNINNLLHNIKVPVLGVCGGHQLIAFAFNQDLRRMKSLPDEPMRKLKPHEPDVDPKYHHGYYKEQGAYEIEIIRRDPIFKGLPKKNYFHLAHFAEVKKLPRDFILLAKSKECSIQAMRHRNRPIYGTQFHPECWTEAYPAGKKIIENFFRIAELL